MRILVFGILVIALSWSCKNESEEKCAYIPDTSSISVDIDISQLQDSVVVFSSKQDLVDFFSRHTVMRDVFFNRSAYPSDSMFINELYNRFSNPYFDSLLLVTKILFGGLTALRNELNTAFKNFRYYYPEVEMPKVETVITGLETDVFVSDSLVIIGLDYFLGDGAKYRPNMYDYILRRYEKDFVVPSIMLLYGIDSRYNKTNLEDRTVLADMISYGKTYYFAKQMLPCVPDSILIGYTREEIEGSRRNSDLIWKRLVEDEVFYATSHLVKQKYIAERPKTLEVGEKCPGRIATWVGWEIVKKYAEVSNESLPEVMANPDAKAIFNKSRYKPL